MGGIGSGRFGANGEKKKVTVEQCVSVDLSEVFRGGRFVDCEWSPEHSVQSVRYLKRVEVSALSRKQIYFHIQVQDRHDTEIAPREFSFRVEIAWTSCNFGGERPWFICPKPDGGCGRRVKKLYLPPDEKRFLCRVCYDLGYTSSHRSRYEDYKHWNKAMKIERRLESRKVRPGLNGGISSKSSRVRWCNLLDQIQVFLLIARSEECRLDRQIRQTEALLRSIGYHSEVENLEHHSLG